MLNRCAFRLGFVLLPVLLLGACGPTASQRTARLLDQRLQVRLSSDIAAGRATLQTQRDGAQVTLLDPSLFSNGKRVMDDQRLDIRADVIEGLLDPSLMRVQVSDTSDLPQYQRDTRVENVTQYFVANGLGSVLRQDDPAPSSATAGLKISIRVQCPKPNGLIGYGDGKSKPVCE